MSLALKHVPSHSVVSSLRVVHLFSNRHWKKKRLHTSWSFSIRNLPVDSPSSPSHPPRHYLRYSTSASELPSSEFQCQCKQQHEVSKQEIESSDCQYSKARRELEQTPTEYLLNAIRKAGYALGDVAIPKSKVDLSWAKPEGNIRPMAARKHERCVSCSLKRPSRLTVQTILADYLQCVDPLLSKTGGTYIASDCRNSGHLDAALREVFSRENLEYLDARGYCVTDVVAWAWIVQSKNAYQAILRLLTLEEYRSKTRSDVQGPPSFILLFLLRQKTLDSKTFRLLLICSLHLMNGESLPTIRTALDPLSSGPKLEAQRSLLVPSPLDPSTCMIYVVRLLRHAREVWPQAQLTIARAFALFLNRSEPEGKDSVKTRRFKAEKFNKCLWLLSLPSRSAPFASATIQHQAQFELLNAMGEHNPILPISRRGYQGVVAVQLARKKTLAERQFAELKAPSWPPWKEEKLGIDFQRGNEGMESRAMQVLSRMKDAGYRHTLWEEVSTIFAGWDTDRSPTIQTRTLMPPPASLSRPRGSKPNHKAIWEARIRTTRTLREAWACFLSYQDQGLPPHRNVYAAMAEKLIFRRKAITHDFDQRSHALPGDGLEVFPEPTSARDLIYVPTEPPTLEEFLGLMVSKGLRISDRFLARLLDSAPDFSSGLDYLRCSDLSTRQIDLLTTVGGRKDPRILQNLSDHLFSSFIAFLCNSSNFDTLHSARHNIRTADLFPVLMRGTSSTHSSLFTCSDSLGESNQGIPHPQTLRHAVDLVTLRSSISNHSMPWRHILYSLSRPRVNLPYGQISRSTQHILAWHEVVHVLGWMNGRGVELGPRGFQILCTSFYKAVAHGIKVPTAAEEALKLLRQAGRHTGSDHQDNVSSTANDILLNGLHILKSEFSKLAYPGSTKNSWEEQITAQVTLPERLKARFHPAVLHAFVRALGLAQDYDSLLKLLRWMSHSATSLKEISEEYANGETMMRRTLVAFRVFLEGAWRNPSLPNVDSSGDDNGDRVEKFESIIDEAYNVFTSTPIWGSWPTDEELADYVHWNDQAPG